MVSGISPWPMAVVENGPRLRNNAMVIPFNSNETVCVRFQRKQNAGFTARSNEPPPEPPERATETGAAARAEAGEIATGISG